MVMMKCTGPKSTWAATTAHRLEGIPSCESSRKLVLTSDPELLPLDDSLGCLGAFLDLAVPAVLEVPGLAVDDSLEGGEPGLKLRDDLRLRLAEFGVKSGTVGARLHSKLNVSLLLFSVGRYEPVAGVSR